MASYHTTKGKASNLREDPGGGDGHPCGMGSKGRGKDPKPQPGPEGRKKGSESPISPKIEIPIGEGDWERRGGVVGVGGISSSFFRNGENSNANRFSQEEGG